LRNIEWTDKFNTQKINIGNQLLSAWLNNIFEEKQA
jgi:hypothetical protein